MQVIASASVMKLNNILLIILLISGYYCVNATEAESSDGKSVEQKKRGGKSKYFLFMNWYLPTHSSFKWMTYRPGQAN